jgi:hypothetical protein
MALAVVEGVVCPFTAKVIGETFEVTSLEESREGLEVMAVCRYKGKE